MADADGASRAAPDALNAALLESACAQALKPQFGQGIPSTLFVGLSGGVDSVVLLTLALAWQHQQKVNQPLLPKLRIVALHAHHGLQPSADAWLEDAVQRCAELGIELVSCRLALAESSEGAARAARYAFFRRQLQRPDHCLLLAHHADDQAETLLLRVAQGRSVQGMPRIRRLGQGWVVRPLLDQRRATLEAFARNHGLDWQEDPTNAELVADRNFIRHQWLPLAQARWPELVPKLSRLAARERQQSELLEALVAGWQQVPVAQARLATGASLLRVWLRGYGETAVTHAALQEFCQQLGAAPDRSPSLRLAAGELRRYADAVHYIPSARLPGFALDGQYQVRSPGELRLPHGLLRVRGPDAQLAVRFAQSLKGRSGAPAVGSRGWQRAQVPPWLRPSHPQLFVGDRRVGLPVAGQPTQLPRRAMPGVQERCWSVLWQPDPVATQGPRLGKNARSN